MRASTTAVAVAAMLRGTCLAVWSVGVLWGVVDVLENVLGSVSGDKRQACVTLSRSAGPFNLKTAVIPPVRALEVGSAR
jgi:hypothetical protein